MATLLITGGAGFIGSNLVHYALAHTADRIVVVDKLTYAGSLLNLESPLKDPRVTFVQADIADRDAMARVFSEHQPSAVLNLAAETHVDRSIDGPRLFVDTNIVGTLTLLETAREFVSRLPAAARDTFRFLHVSTDEVYGSLGDDGQFSEETAYAPNSPYAASKAGADRITAPACCSSSRKGASAKSIMSVVGTNGPTSRSWTAFAMPSTSCVRRLRAGVR